jgi:glycosyltransferase involved in cell wall biosynthesis
MRIVHITSVHNPFDRRIFYKQATSLANDGFEVHLIAASMEALPVVVDGVYVHTVRKARSKFERVFGTGFRVIRKAFKIPADIYHFHDPELIPWCFLLKLVGKRVVMDVHEDYPAQVYGMDWVPRPLRRAVSFVARVLEKVGAKVFDGVVTTDDILQGRFATMKPRGRVISAQNYPVISMAIRAQQISISKYTAQRILFLGGLTQARCGQEFIAALEALDDLPFEVYVGGNHNDEEIVSSLKRSKVCRKMRYVGRVPEQRVERMMIDSSISINLYSNHPNNHSIRSNRLFEALAAGLPVVVSNFPATASFVEKHDCGIAANPEDPGEIATAIRKLVTDPELSLRLGINGREAVFECYDWNIQAGKIRDLYATIGSPWERPS